MVLKTNNYKKFVATAATATLVATAIVPGASAGVTTASFSDVPASYKDAVNFVVSNNFSVGETATSYGITNNIKRGDFASILAKAAGLMDDKAPASGFTDVAARDAVAVNSLKAAGVIGGYTATKFGSTDPIKRGDAAVMLQRALELEAGDAKVDFSDVKDSYKDAVAALVKLGVTNGISDTQFGTDNPIKRGDFAKWLHALKDFVVPVPGPGPVDPVPGSDYNLQITTDKEAITADGADNLNVTVTVIDTKTGKVATNADEVVVEFASSYGTLSHDRATVQDGVAKVKLTSEFSQKAVDAVLTAKVIEAQDGSAWESEIGKLAASKTVKFTPVVGATEANLVKAETNEAGSVTFYYDRTVSLETFLKTANGKFVVDAAGNAVLKDNVELLVAQDKKTDGPYTIRGLKAVPGNDKAIEVILGTGELLIPNDEVRVASGFIGKTGDQIDGNIKKFNFTDPRDPEVTSVTPIDGGYKQLTAKFSEPVRTPAGTKIRLDGGTIAIQAAAPGLFHQNLGDFRSEIKITAAEFLKPGKHSLSFAGVKDYAGRTITNEIFDFTVPAYSVAPAATIAVESPEQFRLKFNHDVLQFDNNSANYPDKADAKKLRFQYFVPNTDPNVDGNGVWEDLPKALFQETSITPGLEYVYELTKDWTRHFQTATTEENYHNYEMRAVIDEDTIQSGINGLLNKRQVLSLNYENSPLNTDDTAGPSFVSPASKFFNDKGLFLGYEVNYDEPVKYRGLSDALPTPSQLQGNSIPNVVVEFLGKDADGKAVTIQGDVLDYVYPQGDSRFDSKDDALLVNVSNPANDLQNLVDNKGYSEDWTLVVRNVTDDVGNSAITTTQALKVPKTPFVPAEFKVKDDNQTVAGAYDGVDLYLNGPGNDTIVLTYTAAVSFVGKEENALNPNNYTLNGELLPKEASIALSPTNPGKVTIILPDGTLDSVTNVLNINRALKSKDGVLLTEQYDIVETPVDVKSTPQQ